MIKFPEVQQHNIGAGAYCGPADVLSVAAGYFGVGSDDIDVVAQELRTNTDGTDPRNMVPLFNRLGLDSEFRQGMTKEELKQLIREKIPVIICIQAYAKDPAVYNNRKDNTNGHFLVARGYEDADSFLCLCLRKLQSVAAFLGLRKLGIVGEAKPACQEVFYFMDSVMPGRIAHLSWEELDKRWHENEGTVDKPEIFVHEAVVVRGGRHKPVYATKSRMIP
jgi:hypothetical protein